MATEAAFPVFPAVAVILVCVICGLINNALKAIKARTREEHDAHALLHRRYGWGLFWLAIVTPAVVIFLRMQGYVVASNSHALVMASRAISSILVSLMIVLLSRKKLEMRRALHVTIGLIAVTMFITLMAIGVAMLFQIHWG